MAPAWPATYAITAPIDVTGTITAKTLTCTNLAVGNKEYDGNATAAINKSSITGLISGETLAAGPTAAFAYQNAGNSKTVTVHTTLRNRGGGGLASNYTLAYTSVTASINKAEGAYCHKQNGASAVKYPRLRGTTPRLAGLVLWSVQWRKLERLSHFGQLHPQECRQRQGCQCQRHHAGRHGRQRLRSVSYHQYVHR